jgi:micrococcal nuclease
MGSRTAGCGLVAAGAFFGIAVGYVIGALQGAERPVNENAVVQELVQETYSISRVVDGDTVDIEEGIEVLLSRIRLLGIDTPERGQPLYREAAQQLGSLIAGREVSLERDEDNTDRYGRLLRYIVVDNQNLNVEMVRLGYARAYMHEGLRYESEILAAEREARENRRGIWQNR